MLQEILSYSFAIRALVVGGLVSLCSALLGVTLVLKRYSMIGDGLSHVGFAALSVALVCNMAPLAVSIPIVVIAAFLLLHLSENGKIQGDAGIALVSSSALAVGVLATSLAGGMNVDVYNYMFGSILAMSTGDVVLSIVLSIFVLVAYLLCYHQIFAVTFDEAFAKASGVNTKFYQFLLAVLTALTIVVGMRIMGTLLISSLIIFPALTSMRVFQSFQRVVASSAVISVGCFVVGIFASFLLDLPVGASIVVVNLFVFLVFFLIGKGIKAA